MGEGPGIIRPISAFTGSVEHFFDRIVPACIFMRVSYR